MKPINALILIALGQAIFIGMLLLVYSTIGEPISYRSILQIALITAFLFGLASYFFFKRFIENRIKSIYRIINFSGTPRSKLKDDAVLEAKKATIQWASERQHEIEQLKEQAKFRREFLGNLAHELKTPVFNVQGYLLTLLEGGLEDEKVNRKFLERASVSTEKMVDIIEDLDQIIQLEVENIQLKTESFQYLKLMDEAIDFVAEAAQAKNIVIQRQKPEFPSSVVADRKKIERVLINLLLNAIHYSDCDSKIDVLFYPLGDAIVTEIVDYGIGIAKEDLPRIFERFYRVDQSRSKNNGGSGLGLAICKHIMESHGETITVKSQLGTGTTFSFSLRLSNQ